MSDSFRTPVQPDKKTENDDDDLSGELTPEAWFKSPTVKTLKRRQLPPGTFNIALGPDAHRHSPLIPAYAKESSNEVGQHWFASRADALTVFERPASSISDLFETSPQRRSSSPLAPMQKRDQTTKYLTVGSSIPLLKKLQLEKDSNKRVLSKEIPMSPKRQNQPPAAKKPRNSSPPSSQQSDDFGDDIPIEELDAILAMTNPQPVAQPVVQKESKVSRLQNYRRLLVMEIHNGTYHVDDSDTQLVEKVRHGYP
jgi:hypothetical protein